MKQIDGQISLFDMINTKKAETEYRRSYTCSDCLLYGKEMSCGVNPLQEFCKKHDTGIKTFINLFDGKEIILFPAPERIRNMIKASHGQEVYSGIFEAVDNRSIVLVECKATEDRIPKGSKYGYYKSGDKIYSVFYTNTETEKD